MPSPDCPNAGSRSRQRPVARSGSPRCRARAVTTLAAIVVVALALARCGGSRPSSPTSPTPAPVAPASPACAAISGGLGFSLGIVNGSLCSAVDSSVVLVYRKDETGRSLGYCSGTVIAQRAVLTAAHCVRSGTAAVDIDLGSGAWVTAESFAPYSEWHHTTSFDVGIVLTGEDLRRAPVPILSSRDASVGESAVIAGWGLDGMRIGQVLRAGIAEITRVGVGELQTQYVQGSAGSGGCGGDSGGPLLVEESDVWAIAGILAAGSQDDCSAAATSYYAKLAPVEIQAFVLEHVPDVQRR